VSAGIAGIRRNCFSTRLSLKSSVNASRATAWRGTVSATMLGRSAGPSAAAWSARIFR
jgi:uncharacterized protein (DUF2132 family)